MLLPMAADRSGPEHRQTGDACGVPWSETGGDVRGTQDHGSAGLRKYESTAVIGRDRCSLSLQENILGRCIQTASSLTFPIT